MTAKCTVLASTFLSNFDKYNAKFTVTFLLISYKENRFPVRSILAINMHYNEEIVLVVALTCVTLVPITFLVIYFFIGRREAREENTPPSR